MRERTKPMLHPTTRREWEIEHATARMVWAWTRNEVEAARAWEGYLTSLEQVSDAEYEAYVAQILTRNSCGAHELR
jgi:hypothetical protein